MEAGTTQELEEGEAYGKWVTSPISQHHPRNRMGEHHHHGEAADHPKMEREKESRIEASQGMHASKAGAGEEERAAQGQQAEEGAAPVRTMRKETSKHEGAIVTQRTEATENTAQ